MFKKLISMVAVLALVLSLCPASAQTAETGLPQDTAIPFRPNASEIRYANGMFGGLFYPDEDIARFSLAEMIYYLTDSSGIEPDYSFSDIENAYGEIPLAKLAGAGVLKGYPDGTIQNIGSVTRAEFAVILTRLLKLEEDRGAGRFNDLSDHWARGAVNAVAAQNLLSGFPDGGFHPDEPLTRAQCVVVLNRLIGKEPRPDKESYYPDLEPDHWAYGDIMAAASPVNLNAYIYRPKTDFSEMNYELPSLEEFQLQCEEKLWKIRSASFAGEFIEAVADCNPLVTKVLLANTLATIRYNLNNADDAALKELYRLNDYMAVLREFMTMRNKRMLESEYRFIYEQLYGSLEAMEENTRLYTDTMLELMAEEDDLEYQYTALRGAAVVTMDGKAVSLDEASALLSSDDLSQRKAAMTALSNYYEKYRYEYDNLLEDLIRVRNAQAAEAGYSSYTQFYQVLNGQTGYSREDIRKFRSTVRREIAPLYQQLQQDAARAQGVEKLRYGVDATTLIPASNPLYDTEETYEKVLEILDSISPQTSQYVTYLKEYHLADVFSGAHKSDMGYTTYLYDYNVPFIYCSSSSPYAVIDDFSHEFGHGLAMFRSTNTLNPTGGYDISETNSYSTQVLLSTRFDQLYENGDAAEKRMLVNLMSLMLSTCMLDEYQEALYDDPGMSQTERVAKYASLQKLYLGDMIDYSQAPAFGDGKLQINDNHVFTSPFYAVDYALALSNAFQIWEMMREDFDSGFDAYIQLIDLSTADFLAATEYAGLASPFDPETIRKLAGTLAAEFAELRP